MSAQASGSDGHTAEYWAGFGAAVDAIEFGVKHGAKHQTAIERARQFALTQWFRATR